MGGGGGGLDLRPLIDVRPDPTQPDPNLTQPVLPVAQGFRTPEEVQRFSDLMDEMCDIVANKHSGSLKGEHGTGRNMAPYVEMEWGERGKRGKEGGGRVRH